MRKVYSVKDFGAVADGVTLDTLAFNRAIRVAAETGGVVFIPDGEYLISGVERVSGIRLDSAENAVVKGRDRIEDYARVPYDPENKYAVLGKGPYGTFAKHAALYAHEAENIEIVGVKVIFNDLAYDKEVPLNPIILDEDSILGVKYIRQPSRYYFPADERPVGLYLSKCKDIRVDNCRFEKSPIYSVWALYCENLVFQSVCIRNSKYQWNGDGLHFSACRRVKIFDCDIDASDDCIAVDGNCGGSSYDFTVKNCRLRTCMHAIRLFTGLDFGLQESCAGDYAKYALHDFRIVPGPTHTNLIFDIAVPFEIRTPEHLLKEEIDSKIRAIDPTYFTVITIDRI